jgi:transposase-like protein
MSQITVISGPERRRVWTDPQKRELVAAVSAPGANVADIADRADLRPNQIYRWRRQMGQAAQGFAEVQVHRGVRTRDRAHSRWRIADKTQPFTAVPLAGGG